MQVWDEQAERYAGQSKLNISTESMDAGMLGLMVLEARPILPAHETGIVESSRYRNGVEPGDWQGHCIKTCKGRRGGDAGGKECGVAEGVAG
jgi:hypothetical protein